jgi:hypothetical protein
MWIQLKLSQSQYTTIYECIKIILIRNGNSFNDYYMNENEKLVKRWRSAFQNQFTRAAYVLSTMIYIATEKVWTQGAIN